MEELKMMECAFEKSAGAMNLIKTARISFSVNDFSYTPKLSTEYRVRIKIFNQLGFEAGNVKIPYLSNSRSSKITDIEAFIYYLGEDGRIVKQKVEKKQVFNDRSKAKNAVNYVAFTFPNLKNGSIIEYRYTRIDKNSLRIEPWLFQDLIPTALSRVTAVVPAYVNMNYHILVSDSLEKDSSYKKYYKSIYNEESRSYTLHNIHSFRMEPLMGSLKDNLQRVEFSLKPANTFESFFISSDKLSYYNRILLRARYFGYQINKNVDGTAALIDSVKKLPRNNDKIAAIYNYVKQNVEWNNEETFYCDSLDGCLKNKTGSNAEMNILLLNLLKKTGIKSYPLLISTKENGNPDPSFESLSQFNGVDVYAVGDSATNYILDCTQKNLTYKIPPYNVLNSNAYLVDEKFNGWVLLVDPRILMENTTFVNSKMDSNGLVKGSMRLSFIGFAKTETLAELKKIKENKQDNKDLLSNPEDLIVDSISMENDKEGNDTLIQRALFHFTPSNTENAYFLNPFMFSSFRKNPFKDSIRYSNIDFGCNQSYSEQINLTLPDNFSVESFPKAVVIRLKDSSISFTRQFFYEGNHLLIRNSFIIKQSYFFKEDYPMLKSFFEKFYALLNEEILLKKKT